MLKILSLDKLFKQIITLISFNMAYGKRFKKYGKRKSFKKFRGRKRGYLRRDYTPSLKLECFTSIRSSAGTGVVSIFDATDTVPSTAWKAGYLNFKNCFDNNGTWGKFKDNYSTYKISGVSYEVGYGLDTQILNSVYAPTPLFGVACFPTEVDAAPGISIASVKQMDNVLSLGPRDTRKTKFIRFPDNYVTSVNAAGVGTWNPVAQSANQVGQIYMTALSAAVAQNTTSFGYIKLCLYVKFGGKKI